MQRTLLFMILASLWMTNVLLGQAPSSGKTKPVSRSPLVTFIELGSVNCIPCKMMQPVMKAIEEKYGSQVKVVLYDVWTREQQNYARQYNIRLIPTQVFLDKDGKEFYRHEGFFPEQEIHALLQKRGLKISAPGRK